MKLFEIDQRIEEIFETMINPETGEVDESKMEELNKLQVERDTKLENVALYIKELKAYSNAIKEEKKALEDRQKVAENKMERLKSYLTYALAGEKFKTSKVDIGYRKSKLVAFNMDEDEVMATLRAVRPDLVRAKWEFDKVKIKDALEKDQKVYGAELKEKLSIQVK